MHERHHRRNTMFIHKCYKIFCVSNKQILHRLYNICIHPSYWLRSSAGFMLHCVLSVAWMSGSVAHISHFLPKLPTSPILVPSTEWSIAFNFSWLKELTTAYQAVFFTSLQLRPHHHTLKQVLYVVPQLLPPPLFSLRSMLYGNVLALQTWDSFYRCQWEP